MAEDQAPTDAAKLRMKIEAMEPTTAAGILAQMKIASFDIGVVGGEDVETEVGILADGVRALAQMLGVVV